MSTDLFYYPPPKFFFSVGILSAGSTVPTITAVDSSFQDVSGIESEFGIEEVVEGGENRFVHRLPKQVKHPPLVLKRGVVTTDSQLAEWVSTTLGSTLSTPITTQTIQVLLLGPGGLPVVAWAFYNAWPLKWTTASLNSGESEVLTETMEFSYSYSVRTTYAYGSWSTIQQVS